jgi:hypothetical protein
MPDIDRIFSDKDFDNMLYAVHRVPAGKSVYAQFKGMEFLPSFEKFKDDDIKLNEVIKYVVFCYDR